MFILNLYFNLIIIFAQSHIQGGKIPAPEPGLDPLSIAETGANWQRAIQEQTNFLLNLPVNDEFSFGTRIHTFPYIPL